jgi:hypothetical protein
VLQSKKKEKIEIMNHTDAKTETAQQRRILPESLNRALDDIISGTVAPLDTTSLRALATHPVGNPVLQLLLELELSRSGKQSAKQEASLFRKLLPDEPPEDGTPTAAFIKGLLFDPVGSVLLEVIVKYAPGKSFKNIYRCLIRQNLGSIVKNEIAGFVIVKVLERLGKEDLSDAAGRICSEIQILVDRSRIAIIKTLVERCQFRGVGEDVTDMILVALQRAYGSSPPEMLVSMLHLHEIDANPADAQRKMQSGPQDNAKSHGSLLAQAMLQSHGPLHGAIIDGLLAMDSQTLSAIAKDRAASRLLQSALSHDPSTKIFRKTAIQKLLGHVPDIATDLIGSHVLDSLWSATEDLRFLRERVAESLQANEAALRDSYAGRVVWRNWMMDLFKRQRTQWIAKGKAHVPGVSQGENSGATAEEGKSNLELARERHAASRKPVPQARRKAGNKAHPTRSAVQAATS